MTVYLWMLGTLLSFCLMAVGVRELSGDIHTLQMLFFRSVIGLCVIGCILLWHKQATLVKTQRFKLHTTRNIFHFLGQFGWFVGIGLMPLANVFALEFTAPIWTLLIASIFLGESLTRKKVTALMLALTGVLVILKPGSELFDPASFIVLAAAFSYAVSYVSTKALTSTEHVLTILFFMNLIQLPMSLPFSFYYWVTPDTTQLAWLLVIGLTALTAHYCMTHAMKLADASTVVMMDFLRLPLIIVVGVVLYQEAFQFSIL
jgi:drug/metabolite transporter (DMT)-like permease